MFDEDRYFAPGDDLLLLRFGDVLVGPTICEDIWQPGPPATDLALAGAQLIANISASPFHVGKDREREEMLRVRARDNSCFVALCNAVGGQDELIFDGHSVVIDDEGELVARAPGFEEALLVVDVDPVAAVGRRLRDVRRRALAREQRPRGRTSRSSSRPREPARARAAPGAAPLLGRSRADAPGTRARPARLRREERLRRRRDRALRAASTRRSRRRSRVEALGADRVHGVSMPSRYSSEGDARRRAAAGRVARHRLPRDRDRAGGRGVQRRAGGDFAGREPDLTEENLQARIRGTLLMALSNKFGWLVDRDRKQVGAVGRLLDPVRRPRRRLRASEGRLQDRRLPARGRLNERAGGELIPQSIIDRAPSAELRADQLDEDSLPPYPKLDRVLEAYVELDRSREELSQDGFDPDVVERALAMIDRAEYKRRQAPPGVKLRPKAFGRDRRTPITNRWPG